MTNQSNSTQDTEDVVARLWQLRRRALSYATDKPAVNFLLSDLAEGLKVAAERINRDQSLSDRIDVADLRLSEAERLILDGHPSRALLRIKESRAALHQEGIAPK